MQVAIIGGGFSGRMAAVRLRREGLGVTLVDAQPCFVERTRLHQAAARGRSAVHDHRQFAHAIGAAFVHGRVVGFDDDQVCLDNGTLRADRVVVAAGSVPDRSVPGVAEHALSLGGPEEVAQIHRALQGLSPGARVLVVGAGLTGLELATEVASAWPELAVTLIGDPEEGLPDAGAAVVRRALAVLGVRTVPAHVREVTPHGLQTDQGSHGAELVLWAAGMRTPGWLRDAGLPLQADGRIRVDGTLRVIGLPRVVAAGDCAATMLRMACASAMPLGAHAADTLIREARGEAPRPMGYRWMVRCVSLGRSRALVQPVDAQDQPRPIALGGVGAAIVKEGILQMAAHLPRWEHAVQRPLLTWSDRGPPVLDRPAIAALGSA